MKLPKTVPCSCCETMWDYGHKHKGRDMTYGDYFRWLELRLTALEPHTCAGDATSDSEP